MRSTESSAAGSAPNAPIGVFDSGVGGLTVLRELRRCLPCEDFVYLGDTARLPYGTKSPGSIRQYSLQAARLLLERGVKCLVVACNTASAVALDALAAEFAPTPVLGVLEPGATRGPVGSPCWRPKAPCGEALTRQRSRACAPMRS
jgi:glutamate racemase